MQIVQGTVEESFDGIRIRYNKQLYDFKDLLSDLAIFTSGFIYTKDKSLATYMEDISRMLVHRAETLKELDIEPALLKDISMRLRDMVSKCIVEVEQDKGTDTCFAVLRSIDVLKDFIIIKGYEKGLIEYK